MIPYVSVLTCRGGEEYLDRCLKSIRAEYAGPIHLVCNLPGLPDNLEAMNSKYDKLVVHDETYSDARIPEEQTDENGRKRVAIGHQRMINQALSDDDTWTHLLAFEDDAELEPGWLDEILNAEKVLTETYRSGWGLWSFHYPDGPTNGRGGVPLHLPGVGEINTRRVPMIGSCMILWCRDVLKNFSAFIDEQIIDTFMGPFDMRSRHYFRRHGYRAFTTLKTQARHIGKYSRKFGRPGGY